MHFLSRQMGGQPKGRVCTSKAWSSYLFCLHLSTDSSSSSPPFDKSIQQKPAFYLCLCCLFVFWKEGILTSFLLLKKKPWILKVLFWKEFQLSTKGKLSRLMTQPNNIRFGEIDKWWALVWLCYCWIVVILILLLVCTSVIISAPLDLEKWSSTF